LHIPGRNLGFTLEIYWKRNCLTTGSLDTICQFRVTSLGPIINSSLALFVPIIIIASTIGKKKKDERHRDELIIWICNFFVEVVQVNVTWISSDDGDQYSITREEMHDNNRILVGSFYPKVQHKYSQKHYHTILFVNILHKTCSWSTTWRQHEESRVICCIIVHYTFCSTVVLHNFSYISLKTEKKPGKTLEFHIWKRVGTLYYTPRASDNLLIYQTVFERKLDLKVSCK
jgi:hypothetical protein